MKLFVKALVVCSAAVSLGATAQVPTTPPKVLSLYREEVKPARAGQHATVEAAYAAHWAKFGVQPYLALSAITGPASDVLFISDYAGWDGMDKDMASYDKGAAAPEFAALARQEADLVSSVKAAIAVYREELSYNAAKLMQDLPRSRYMWVRTMRVKPGHDGDFVEMGKLNLKAHADAKMEEAWVVYQVIAGAQAGTYLAFSPSRTFAEEESVEPTHKAMREKAGAEYAAQMKKLAEESIAYDQWDVWGMSPKMSHVSREFAAADAAFWTPKAADAKAGGKTMTKKEQKKP